MRTLLILLAVSLAMPAGAHAARPLAQPPMPRPFPQIIHAECPGNSDIAGCYIGAGEADLSGNVYEQGAVFVAVRGRFALLHEIGHAFDASMMDAAEREAFTRIMRERDLLWTWSYEEGELLIQDPGTPAEQFGDAYAACRMGNIVAPGKVWQAGYDYYPTARQHRRVCALITRAGLDAGTPVADDGSR